MSKSYSNNFHPGISIYHLSLSSFRSSQLPFEPRTFWYRKQTRCLDVYHCIFNKSVTAVCSNVFLLNMYARPLRYVYHLTIHPSSTILLSKRNTCSLLSAPFLGSNLLPNPPILHPVQPPLPHRPHILSLLPLNNLVRAPKTVLRKQPPLPRLPRPLTALPPASWQPRRLFRLRFAPRADVLPDALEVFCFQTDAARVVPVVAAAVAGDHRRVVVGLAASAVARWAGGPPLSGHVRTFWIGSGFFEGVSVL